MAKKPLYIDCIAGSQLRDTQGEMLSVEGADISDLEQGKGRWNDNHGKGFFNSIGRITEAKKIFKAEDCQNDRHKYYWEKVKAPFIYAAGYLYDDEDHPNAKAAAAILRNIHKSDIPLKLKASVEGGVVARDPSDSSLLAKTKIHSVALTFTPANNATLVEPLTLDKSYDEKSDMEIIKSVMHLAQTNIPSFRHITRDASANKVHSNLQKISELIGNDSDIDLNISKEQILDYAIETKIISNVNKINRLAKQLKEEDLDKGIKEALAGAVLGASVAASPVDAGAKISANGSPSSSVNLSRMPSSHQDAYVDVSKIDPILGAIGKVESSGGVNYKHRTIKNPKSMHYGHTAGGMFGMMPHDAGLILKNDQELASKYPELRKLANNVYKNHKTFTDALNSSPSLAIDFATAAINRHRKFSDDPHFLFYAWNSGLTGALKARKLNKKFTDNEYVKDALEHLKNTPSIPLTQVSKSLTAGYGGSGAPSSMVGGSVLQSESVEKPLKGLKYITCDDCGKEQIYAKYQVKCRKCNKSWSLAKIQSVFKV